MVESKELRVDLEQLPGRKALIPLVIKPHHIGSIHMVARLEMSRPEALETPNVNEDPILLES